MTTSPHIFVSPTLWTAPLVTLGFRLGSRWKTAQQKGREVSVGLFFLFLPVFFPCIWKCHLFPSGLTFTGFWKNFFLH